MQWKSHLFINGQLKLTGYFFQMTAMLESNKFPFKVKFTGHHVYGLKKEIIVELAPKLNSFAAVNIGISPFEAVLFLALSSIFSSLISLQFSREPSIGAS